MTLFLLLFIGFSISHTIAYLHIFHWFRILLSGMSDRAFDDASRRSGITGFRAGVLGRLIRCHACVGFWIGVSLYSFNGAPIIDSVVLISHGEAVGFGFLQLGFNSFVWLLLRRFGAEEL